MSIKASEIVTAMTTMLKEALIDLHQQNINDVQAIVSRLEERLIIGFDAINKRIDVLEAQRRHREADHGE